MPIGKLHSERWTPVDGEVRSIIARLQYLRTLPPTAPPEFLLPRPKGKQVLCTQLRDALNEAAVRAGIKTHIVPHQMRHTYATSMLRAGVSLPALMKMLGHRSANMTLRYVEITQQDLQREFHRARENPRHLVPVPPSASVTDPIAPTPPAIIEGLTATARALDLFGQQNPSTDNRAIVLLLRRLARIRSQIAKIAKPQS